MSKFKNFKLSEFIYSETAKKNGIENVPDFEHVERISFLVEHLVQPLRGKYGKSLRISSGFRTPELNIALAGAKNSQHMCLGDWAAVDLDTGNHEENKKLFNLIKDNFEFDQLIDEHDFDWVHVSLRTDGKNRKQILKIG